MNFNEKIVDQILCKAKTEKLISILPFNMPNEHLIVYYAHTTHCTTLVHHTEPVPLVT